MHRAYRSPLFLVPAFILMLSTAVCAWDRTSFTRKLAALGRGITPALASRLARRPTFSVSVEDSRSDRGLSAASDSLSHLGMRVTVDGDRLLAVSNTWAVWGSAVFHWSLVGLFVAAGAGQLIKWEGQIGIPVGHRLTDVAGSYGQLVRGPLAPKAPSTGYTLEVAQLELDHSVGGVARGPAPLVRLYSGDAVAAQGYVYPNSPLSYRGLTIHRGEWGIGVVAALETLDGKEIGRRNFLFDFEDTRGTGRLAIEEGLPEQLGVGRLRFAVPLDRSSGGRFKADLALDPRVEITTVGSAEATVSVLRAGDKLAFPGGTMQLRIVDITRYARLFVVADPMIPFVYAFLILAALGGTVALLIHPRVVVARVHESENGASVDVLVIAKRVDPLFEARVREALDPLADKEDTE
jgi:cytochrome c biogenesis protein ResB